jgi:diphthamide synthase (EF-2-diphthine--ammonia ligase)
MQPERFAVRGVFTTITQGVQRVSVHSTPTWVLQAQAARLGVPLYDIPIPDPCSNAQYESAMEQFLARMRDLPPHLAESHLAFGDLFLEDIRRYREEKLRGTGFNPVFPVWGRDTASLAEEMIVSGLKAIVTSVNPAVLPPEFAGRWFDRKLIADLPPGVDPLGENGEFHTCVVDGPMLSSRIDAGPGRVVHPETAAPTDSSDSAEARDPHPTYVHADIVPSGHPPV